MVQGGGQTKEGRRDGAQDWRQALLLLLFRGAWGRPITLS